MTTLTFGEKLEQAFESTNKQTKLIGNSPVSFVSIVVDGVDIELIRSVGHPWFWKLVYVKTGVVKLLKSEWDLPYVAKN